MADAFCKIANIAAESTDKLHPDAIEILSFNHGLNHPESGASISSVGNLSGGRVRHDHFRISKQLDKASPELVKFCCNHGSLGTVEIFLCRAVDAEKKDYFKYTLENAVVMDVAAGGAGEGGIATENVAFGYEKITWTYTETAKNKTGGNTEAEYSLVENA